MAPPPKKKPTRPPASPAPTAAPDRAADFAAAFAGTGILAWPIPPELLAWRRDEAAGVVVAVTNDGRKVTFPILAAGDDIADVEPTVEEGVAP